MLPSRYTSSSLRSDSSRSSDSCISATARASPGWGAGILASSISLWSLAGYAYVEWGLLAFCTLAFWALRNALDQERASWLLVSGICLGLALGVKYTAAFVALGLGSYLLWTTIRRDTLLAKSFPNWQHLGLWMLTVATVASPWYLKNLAFTGNPFYPFFFGGRNWDAWRDAWFTRWGTGLLQEPVRLLTAPWDLGVLASEGSLLYDVSLSPLLLGFMPLLLLLRRAAAPWTASALWVALVAYGGWLLGAAQSELLLQGRLLLPALPLFAAALAVALAESRRLALPWLRTSFLLEATLVLVLTLQGLTLVSRWAADPPVPYLAGAESREVYLERHLGAHYRALNHLNQTVSPEASVLFLWEPRTYLCRVQCQPDALLYNWRDFLRRHEGIDPCLHHAAGAGLHPYPAQRQWDALFLHAAARGAGREPDSGLCPLPAALPGARGRPYTGGDPGRAQGRGRRP